MNDLPLWSNVYGITLIHAWGLYEEIQSSLLFELESSEAVWLCDPVTAEALLVLFNHLRGAENYCGGTILYKKKKIKKKHFL